MAFVKATKKKAKLRLACYGPSGSGKTVSGIRVLCGMCNKVACIDTERGRAAKCASDWGNFDVMEIDPTTDIDRLIECMNEAASCGYDGLMVDSMSHSWNTLLNEVSAYANAKLRGNTYAAWGVGKFGDKQARLVDAIMSYPGHVWATMRSKTAWAEEKDDRGKMKPVKIGLDPKQGKDIEYEFDFLLSMTPEHFATIEKGPRGFGDRVIATPDEAFGAELLKWLDAGEEAVPSVNWEQQAKSLIKGCPDDKKATIGDIWKDSSLSWEDKCHAIQRVLNG